MKEEVRRNESREVEQGETADRMMRRATGRLREGEGERNGQMKQWGGETEANRQEQ